MNAVRVAKVGGSLLDFGELVSALRKWLALQPPLATVLVCGGGPYTDMVRDADLRFGYGETKSHWLCIEALSTTARILASNLPEATLERDGIAGLKNHLGQPSNPAISALFVFDPQPFLRTEETLLPDPLPETWNVTSDSIAARVAEALDAAELVLLKSAPADTFSTWADAAASGYVDAYFPQAARKLPRVRAVNLRDVGFGEAVLPYPSKD